MTFASPLWLAAAATVIVPILIHLFGRPRPKLQRFPSLMLLRRVQREHRSAARLRRIASLLLRCLALLLLALVMSAPRSDAPALARLGEPFGLPALIIDCSPSMDARLATGRPIDRAREAALALLQAMPDRAEVIVQRTDADASVVLRVVDAERMIATTSVGDRRARLGECIAAVLDAQRPASRIIIATDLQASSLEALSDVPAARVPVVVLDAGGAVPGNSAIVSVRADSPVALAARALELQIGAHTWGEGPGRVPVTAECADASVTAGIDLLPESAAFAALALTPPHDLLLSCAVRLPADAMPGDDEALFAARVRERLRVALLGSEEETRFIAAALDPWPEGDPRSTVEVVRAPALSADDPLDAVIFASASTEARREALLKLMERGVGALAFADADRPLLDALGLGGVTIGEPVRREDGAALAELATDRAPLAAFAEPGAGDLTASLFTRRPEVRFTGAGAAVLARYDDGTPALIEGATGRGTTLLLATSPDDAWGDLVRAPEFVPLMHRLVTHLAAGTEPAILPGAPGEATAVGQAFQPVNAWSVGQASQPVNVPSGQTSEPVTTSDRHLRFTPSSRGVYEIRSGEEEFAAVAVNLDPAEADPARLSPDEVRERLSPLPAEVVESEALEGFLARLRPESVDLSSFLALLVLLVLAVESVQSISAAREATGSADSD